MLLVPQNGVRYRDVSANKGVFLGDNGRDSIRSYEYVGYRGVGYKACPL